jgi:hypothetical protein
MALTVDDLLTMTDAQRMEIVRRAYPIDPSTLDDTQYLGIDLSLPDWVHKLLWTTFRKTFHRDPATGVLRGWNVKLEQTGIHGPKTPKKRRNGTQLSFGHYQLRSAKGLKFPRGWSGENYLDYGVAGNPVLDVAKLGYCPLVAVNEGSSDLLLGWEVFKLGPLFIPLTDFWLLVREGPLERIEPPPVPSAVKQLGA